MNEPLNDSLESAKKLLAEGEISAAKSLLLDTTEMYGDSWKVWILLAGIATREFDIEGSIEAFRKLAFLSPGSAFASSGLANSLFRAKQYEQTMKEIDRFAKVADSSDSVTERVLSEHSSMAEKIANL